MSEADWYAPGTYNDPNAPWNEPPSPEEMFEDKANEIIDDEIENRDDEFTDFLSDHDLYPDHDHVTRGIISQECYDAILDAICSDDTLCELYRDHRFHDVCERLYEEYCDVPEPDYDPRDDYED